MNDDIKKRLNADPRFTRALQSVPPEMRQQLHDMVERWALDLSESLQQLAVAMSKQGKERGR